MANHSNAGMCKNAFGGHSRLDKCNLQGASLLGDELVDVESSTPPERVLWTACIANALNDYLFWGLGRNGTSAEEFWHSCEFLFNVRASKPETWMPAKVMRSTYDDEVSGRRVTHVQELSDDVLQAECLDHIWAHLEFRLPLQQFCSRLQAKRRRIVTNNWQQIRCYLRLTQDFARWEASLVGPTMPEQVEELLRCTTSNHLVPVSDEALMMEAA